MTREIDMEGFKLEGQNKSLNSNFDCPSTLSRDHGTSVFSEIMMPPRA